MSNLNIHICKNKHLKFLGKTKQKTTTWQTYIIKSTYVKKNEARNNKERYIVTKSWSYFLCMIILWNISITFIINSKSKSITAYLKNKKNNNFLCQIKTTQVTE